MSFEDKSFSAFANIWVRNLAFSPSITEALHGCYREPPLILVTLFYTSRRWPRRTKFGVLAGSHEQEMDNEELGDLPFPHRCSDLVLDMSGWVGARRKHGRQHLGRD